MFTAIATRTGWSVFLKGNPAPVATFARLSTVKAVVDGIGGKLTVVIGGYELT